MGLAGASLPTPPPPPPDFPFASPGTPLRSHEPPNHPTPLRFPERAADPRAVLHFVKHAPFPMSRAILQEMAATWPSE